MVPPRGARRRNSAAGPRGVSYHTWRRLPGGGRRGNRWPPFHFFLPDALEVAFPKDTFCIPHVGPSSPTIGVVRDAGFRDVERARDQPPRRRGGAKAGDD